MKKFIVRGVLFLVCTVFFYLVALIVWGSYFPLEFRKNLNYRIGASGYTYTRLHEADTSHQVKVLFLGSSHAYRGFDTRIFNEHGFTSFNLGTSSQTPMQTEVLLDKFLDKFKPAWVVYETYPYTFSSDGIESSVDIIANSTIDYSTLMMALRLNHLKTYNTFIFGLFRQAIGKDKGIKENLVQVTTTGGVKDFTRYIKGGFTERTREWIRDDSLQGHTGNKILRLKNEEAILTDIQIVQTKEGKWNPERYQLNSFERILKRLREKDIKVILVQAPINSKYYQKVLCNKEIDNYFSSRGEYHNFNELIQFDNEQHFIDFDHLNQAGVKKFNEALIEKVFTKN